MGGVTEAGDVKNIDLNLLIRRGGRPGIEISFKAISSSNVSDESLIIIIDQMMKDRVKQEETQATLPHEWKRGGRGGG